MATRRIRSLVVLLLGVCLGAAGYGLSLSSAQPAHAKTTKPATAEPDWAPQIAEIKGKLPSQSHTMQDVSYHFANLWFAGKHENWDLAEFYWDETRSHLHWAVRVIPVRKDNAGNDVNLQDILQGFENGPLHDLHDAITAHDEPVFEKTYRSSLENCYSCHKAADKPYLRLQIPSEPESPLVNFDPQAAWPR